MGPERLVITEEARNRALLVSVNGSFIDNLPIRWK